MMKLCRNCKHYQPNVGTRPVYDICLLTAVVEMNPVNGGKEYRWFNSAGYQREKGDCGIEAKNFEQASVWRKLFR